MDNFDIDDLLSTIAARRIHVGTIGEGANICPDTDFELDWMPLRRIDSEEQMRTTSRIPFEVSCGPYHGRYVAGALETGNIYEASWEFLHGSEFEGKRVVVEEYFEGPFAIVRVGTTALPTISTMDRVQAQLKESIGEFSPYEFTLGVVSKVKDDYVDIDVIGKQRPEPFLRATVDAAFAEHEVRVNAIVSWRHYQITPYHISELCYVGFQETSLPDIVTQNLIDRVKQVFGGVSKPPE